MTKTNEKSRIQDILIDFNGEITREESGFLVFSETGKELVMSFREGPACVLQEGLYVQSLREDFSLISGRELGWVLPRSYGDGEASVCIRCHGDIRIHHAAGALQVVIPEGRCIIRLNESRPCTDIFGHAFVFDFPGGDTLSRAFAAFYWDTMIPCVVERTLASGYPLQDGYVLSTLQKGAYPGTYPDVDHEFQTKGRLAMGNALDTAVVRRMTELQFRLMEEDPEGLWRDPCSLQPDGVREYHIRRNSMDRSQNAEMFLVTGNIEVVETAWLYVASTGDREWLERWIGHLEGAMSLVEDHTDRQGRLWSDVYYEDQVIKDGRECMAGALAARSFRLLAELEALLDKEAVAEKYRKLAERMETVLTGSLPVGFWDDDHERFVDWVDRCGVVHDHIHLLANLLPPLFGFASAAQTLAVRRLMDSHQADFRRFPSFVSPRVEDYTDSEIGDGGPYDLCAAGRYWFWDAAWLAAEKQRQALADQLLRVAGQALREGGIMAERYDMGHVYYQDGKDYHGAEHYYEYPCVFVWVMLQELVGVRLCLDADLAVMPCLPEFGRVKLESERYQLAYQYEETTFTLTNLAARPRAFRVDLSALYPEVTGWWGKHTPEILSAGAKIMMEAGETVTFRPVPVNNRSI